MLAGCAHIPGIITNALIEKYKAQLPAQLLSHINLNKERVSLAQSLAGRYVLWQLMQTTGIYTETVQLGLTDYKQPILENSNWQFSISHSGDIAVCVLSDRMHPGIDIELIKAIDISDFKSQFTNAEYDCIQHDTTYQTFYRLWTAKEAIAKAAGKGLYIDFKTITPKDNNEYIFDNFMWYIKEVQVSSSYICNIAANQPIPEFRLQQFNINQ